MDVIDIFTFILAFLVGTCQASSCRYGYYYSYYFYCDAGCCGYYYNQYCCTRYDVRYIVGAIVGCLIVVGIIAFFVILCCKKHVYRGGQRGTVIQPVRATAITVVGQNNPNPPLHHRQPPPAYGAWNDPVYPTPQPSVYGAPQAGSYGQTPSGTYGQPQGTYGTSSEHPPPYVP